MHEGPCRVWGPQRIMPGLRVFIGECAVSIPSLESPPQKVAGSGQPLWGRAPSLFEHRCPPEGDPKTLGQQDTGGTEPHTGTRVQPSQVPVQASVGIEGAQGHSTSTVPGQ